MRDDRRRTIALAIQRLRYSPGGLPGLAAATAAMLADSSGVVPDLLDVRIRQRGDVAEVVMPGRSPLANPIGSLSSLWSSAGHAGGRPGSLASKFANVYNGKTKRVRNMPVMPTVSPLARMAEVAADPDAYALAWKQAHPGGKVAGVLPMNFPEELLHAAGFLPVVIQENSEPDSEGRVILAEFYCGYTRNLADQAVKGKLAHYDAYFVADHCVQLLGAADVMRYAQPEIPIYFGQFIASMSESSTNGKVRGEMGRIVREVERSAGAPIDQGRLRNSIRLYNEDRSLLRKVFDARRDGRLHLPAKQIQDLVKSSMIMEKAEHVALLRELLTHGLGTQAATGTVKLHLSGHFCHAPKQELLDLIEECGAEVVDDDLYHGRRYITTDVREDLDPIDALTEWYFDRNVNVPCPTRVQHDADWDTYLSNAVNASGADGVIVLMAKFCEPHMLLYPELRKMMDEREIPYLLIETEHEGLPMESIRTRVEALVERISRRPARVAG